MCKLDNQVRFLRGKLDNQVRFSAGGELQDFTELQKCRISRKCRNVGSHGNAEMQKCGISWKCRNVGSHGNAEVWDLWNRKISKKQRQIDQFWGGFAGSHGIAGFGEL